jgi:carbon monoxide dehydrogenase subunit G
VHFEGTVSIAAPRSAVWDFVTDPERVGTCGPGVETVEKLDETNFRARAKVGIGLFRARFNVDAKMVEQVPPERAVIQARGQAPGSAVDATATMELSDGPDGGTVMAWSADVVVGGTVASIGARLLEGTANKMIGQTFECMRQKLES